MTGRKKSRIREKRPEISQRSCWTRRSSKAPSLETRDPGLKGKSRRSKKLPISSRTIRSSRFWRSTAAEIKTDKRVEIGHTKVPGRSLREPPRESPSRTRERADNKIPRERVKVTKKG